MPKENMEKKQLEKNLAILPAWLNTFAEENHIQFSQVLQNAFNYSLSKQNV